jgi:hypothetical protein
MTRMTTYSFRAPAELGERMERTRDALAGLSGPDGERILRELNIGLARRSAALGELKSQSELIREVVEILIRAVEKVEEDKFWEQQYRAYLDERTEEEKAEDDAWGEAGAKLMAEGIKREKESE